MANKKNSGSVKIIDLSEQERKDKSKKAAIVITYVIAMLALWAGLFIPGTSPAFEGVFAAHGHQPPFCASATHSGGRCSVCPLGLDWRHSSPSRKHGRGGASPGSQDPERDAEPG